MDIFSVLSYLNKISLFAFIITAGFLGYQFYLLKKESKPSNKKAPVIPDFNESEKVDSFNYTKLSNTNSEQNPVIIKKDNKKLTGIFISSGLLVLTLGVFLLLRSKQSSQISQVTNPAPILKPTKVIAKIITPTVIETFANNKLISPTINIIVTPTLAPTSKLVLTITPSPTEVILAKISQAVLPTDASDLQQSLSPTTIINLPLTGVIDQGLILFGISATLIFLAFVF